jgi:hypothetical protein
MRVRSPGSLVTTGAWWRMAVAMTIASTMSAVPEGACGRRLVATPAPRPRAYLTTLGRWCRIRSYLDSAANDGLTTLDAISSALAGTPWLPMTQPAVPAAA